MERLQRFLAESGVASRRHAEELILEGRVKVDGQVVKDLGVRVDPARQRIEVDGKLVRPQRKRYLLLNKPAGYITTAQDERGRRTVLDLVQVPERVVPVGRLDRQTSGLLLLTNDGELAYRVAHPKFELAKEYLALVDGHPPPEVLERLRRGVVIEGERITTEQIKPISNEEDGLILSIVIHEGRNRIVRRMLERVGYPAISLERVRIGPLSVRGIPVGTWRDLTAGELEEIYKAVGMPEGEAEPRARPRTPSSESRPRTAPPAAERRPTGRPPARRGAPSRPAHAPGQRTEGGPRREEDAGRSGGPRRGTGRPGGSGGYRRKQERVSGPATGRPERRPPRREAPSESESGRETRGTE
ncbi:MAG TPA: pseudouridine synthase, partial [Thermomicrobiaceae bacterium]|nr:pseudouridine synthase [Thermomicrobiaceae bacterium]